MSTYAKVQNGEILEHNRTLPFSTETTSFGINSSSEDLLAHGYYPVIGFAPELTEFQRIDGVTYEVDTLNNVVNKVYSIKELTPEEIKKAQVPSSITMRQARLQLLAQNLLTTVDTAIQTGTDEALKIEWEYATEIKRDYPSLISLFTALNKTEAEIDDLFILAATL